MKICLSILLLSSLSAFSQNRQETPELKSSATTIVNGKNTYKIAKKSPTQTPTLKSESNDKGVLNKEEVLLLKSNGKAPKPKSVPTLSATGKEEEK